MKRILDIFPVWVSLAFFLACVFSSSARAELIIPTGSSSGVCGSCNFESPGCWASGCNCQDACYYSNILSTYTDQGYTCVGSWVGTPGYCGNSTCGLNTSGNFGATWSGYCYKNESNPDSVYCDRLGKYWQNGECLDEPICDSTFNCVEYPFERCEDVPVTGEVYCDENGCTGLPYSRWWSEYRKECTNECGEHITESVTSDTLITFDSSCDDSLKCSNEQFCVDFPSTGSYYLYTKCSVGNQQVGNVTTNRVVPSIVSSGRGSCASLGMPSTNFPNSGNPPTFPNSNNNNNVSDNCLIYGIDCPENFADTSNYNDSDNRNPDHCICEPLDGSHYTSTIICPDGTRSTFWGSCEDWQGAFSSSSALSSSSSANPPESSSSGSENPPTSSGGISGEYPDWNVIYRNQNNINTALGSIVQSVKTMAGDIVAGVKSLLSGYDYNYTDSYPDLVVPDSMLQLDTILDTAGLLHAVFGRIDSNNTILDTLQHSSFTGCPCITFFAGNTQNSITAGHLFFKEMKLNLGDFHGFNLCRIISAVVVALASVVSFFIGFAIFKNVSQ